MPELAPIENTTKTPIELIEVTGKSAMSDAEMAKL